MRIATYNIEWFDHLFDKHGEFVDDHSWSGRYNIHKDEQIAALLQVFRALDADAILVVEAPDSSRHRSGVTALETFAKRAGIRANKALIGFENDTQQELILLYDPQVLSAVHDPQTGPRFDKTYQHDLNANGKLESIEWSKPPLEAALQTKTGHKLRLIGVHAKSKAPHGASNPTEVMQQSIKNRRKQLAQCMWLRERVEQHLAAGDDLIVLGDFNDGPGLDEYETLFGRSSVEIVLGEAQGESQQAPPEMRLYDPHAQMVLSRRGAAAYPATARFKKRGQKRFLSALLDYIMVSSGLRARSPEWRIWHPFDDLECYENKGLCAALLTASDHFPVTLDIEL